jgi:hypothetical protein
MTQNNKPSFYPPQPDHILGFKNKIKDTWNYPIPLFRALLLLTRPSSTLSLRRFVLRLARHIGIVRMTRPLVLSHYPAPDTKTPDKREGNTILRIDNNLNLR